MSAYALIFTLSKVFPFSFLFSVYRLISAYDVQLNGDDFKHAKHRKILFIRLLIARYKIVDRHV